MSGVLRTVGKVAGIVALVATVAGNPAIAAIASAVAPNAAIAAPLTARHPMTAMNLFEDGRRAYIAADSAYFLPDATIAYHAGKVACLPEFHLAIGLQGHGTPGGLVHEIERVCPIGTQADVLSALPEALAGYRLTLEGDTRLWLASYDRSRAAPRLHHIATNATPDVPQAVPYVLHDVEGWTTGLTPDDVAAALPEGYIADPVEDSRRLLNAQRQYAFPHLNGACGVGGTGWLYTVSRRGVSWRPILQFPEQAGEKCDPAKAGEVIA